MRWILILMMLMAGGALAVRAQMPIHEGLIAFVSDIDEPGNTDIYLIDAAGGTPRRLTTTPGEDTLPDWSPDGERIVYQGVGNGGAPDLFVIDKDGTNIVRLTNTTYAERGPQWSPDGAQIVFAADPSLNQYELYLMDADGTNIRQITDLPGTNASPTWSPDGREIAFYSDDGMMIVNLGTGAVRTLGEIGTSLAWSPDGSQIAFNPSSAPSQWLGMFYYDLARGRVFDFPNSTPQDNNPTWSPDGAWLALSWIDLVSGDDSLVIMDVTTGERTVVFVSDATSHRLYPDWQPALP